jgi:twitching motility protein PilT
MPPIKDLLQKTVDAGASDLHLIVDHPPLIRVHTILAPLDGEDVLTADQTEAYARDLLSETQQQRLAERRDCDFSASLPRGPRFRVNAHYQRGSLAMAFRVIPEKVPALETLNLPAVVVEFANLPTGLVLVTGETGSGKSTTLASVIDYMNQRYRYHVITLEDPVEYSLVSHLSTIEQREVGIDVSDFKSGLRHALRQDPDVILIGEMRDLETISTALTAAETGHVVLSTLHTNDAASTVERIIDIFPAAQQGQIRSMLANTLRGVICQRLFPRLDRPGMVPACEVLVSTPAVRNCIRENRVFEVPQIIETNRALGMQLFDESLKQLYFNGRISRDDALANARMPDQLERVLSA